ncbi:MAG TPA: TIGR03619 family F420-dependent LLM class oxidoreductase [Streptosporangiaceae bacterium]|jgi:probable F420-dependent oxidoreductase|nr:TIGR03619 family F420-dependent LLM class oxidoreductase [Streptosporangiaceae bacterium]
MRVGFALPQFGGQARQADRVAWFAAEAERLGAQSFWAGDRLLAPVKPVIGYSGTSTMPAEFRSLLDPLAVLTLAAAATTSAQLGTSVLNLPWYPPIALARSLTTIDVASGGRLIPGFGSGWSPDEYQAVRVPWRNRGAQLNESLDALEAIWSASPVGYHGAVWEMPDSYVDLKPVQRPRPPIYLGGVSEAALRRIGRRADGWLPAGRIPDAFEPELFLRQRELIRQAAEEAGRDITELPAVVRVNVRAGIQERQIADAMAKVARGTGLEHFFVDLMYLADDVEKALDIAARILSLV